MIVKRFLININALVGVFRLVVKTSLRVVWMMRLEMLWSKLRKQGEAKATTLFRQFLQKGISLKQLFSKSFYKIPSWNRARRRQSTGLMLIFDLWYKVYFRCYSIFEVIYVSKFVNILYYSCVYKANQINHLVIHISVVLRQTYKLLQKIGIELTKKQYNW